MSKKPAGKTPRRARKTAPPAPDPRRRRAASSPDLPRRSTTVSMREDLRARVQAIADARGWTFGAVLEEIVAMGLDEAAAQGAEVVAAAVKSGRALTAALAAGGR